MKLVNIIKGFFTMIWLLMKGLFWILFTLFTFFNAATAKIFYKKGYNDAMKDKLENFAKEITKEKIEYDLKPKQVKL